MGSQSPRLDALRARVEAVCARERGRKSRLAEYLGVRPHMITEWLAGKQPGAEYTLGIVEWVDGREREDGQDWHRPAGDGSPLRHLQATTAGNKRAAARRVGFE
ncbi:MAG: hypothetical protein WD342_17435 [Verrucomicrobiales bacterium]